jgi:hypothetical protein
MHFLDTQMAKAVSGSERPFSGNPLTFRHLVIAIAPETVESGRAIVIIVVGRGMGASDGDHQMGISAPPVSRGRSRVWELLLAMLGGGVITAGAVVALVSKLEVTFIHLVGLAPTVYYDKGDDIGYDSTDCALGLKGDFEARCGHVSGVAWCGADEKAVSGTCQITGASPNATFFLQSSYEDIDAQTSRSGYRCWWGLHSVADSKPLMNVSAHIKAMCLRNQLISPERRSDK